jgi:hypothetical protein
MNRPREGLFVFFQPVKEISDGEIFRHHEAQHAAVEPRFELNLEVHGVHGVPTLDLAKPHARNQTNRILSRKNLRDCPDNYLHYLIFH